MFVCMNELPWMHFGAKDFHFTVPPYWMDMGMANTQTPRNCLETDNCHFVEIADAAICNCAATT